MALNDDEVALLVAKYARERDRFQKLVGFVHRQVEAVLKRHLIRCVVTSRAKDPESLARKIWNDRDKLEFEELRDEFNPGVLDVAGVRVMLYEFERDNKRVVALLEDLFEVPAADRFRKDKGLTGTRCYQARHRVIQLRGELLEDPAHENLRDLMCEIQVVSLVKHIWNELEHDVRYKDPEKLGEADREQEAWLSVLWDSLQAAETAVEHLSRVTDKRREGRQDEERTLGSSEDLRLALGSLLHRPIVGEMGVLFKLLNQTEDKLTRKSLREMGLGHQKALDEGQARLVAAGRPPSDEVEAIVGYLFPDRGEDFLELTSAWRGPKSKVRKTIEALCRLDPGDADATEVTDDRS